MTRTTVFEWKNDRKKEGKKSNLKIQIRFKTREDGKNGASVNAKKLIIPGMKARGKIMKRHLMGRHRVDSMAAIVWVVKKLEVLHLLFESIRIGRWKLNLKRGLVDHLPIQQPSATAIASINVEQWDQNNWFFCWRLPLRFFLLRPTWNRILSLDAIHQQVMTALR